MILHFLLPDRADRLSKRGSLALLVRRLTLTQQQNINNPIKNTIVEKVKNPQLLRHF